MIPEKSTLLREISELQDRKKLREKELEKFLDHIRELRKEVEEIDSTLKSRWAAYNKFYPVSRKN